MPNRDTERGSHMVDTKGWNEGTARVLKAEALRLFRQASKIEGSGGGAEVAAKELRDIGGHLLSRVIAFENAG
jgi:hypothetical protein